MIAITFHLYRQINWHVRLMGSMLRSKLFERAFETVKAMTLEPIKHRLGQHHSKTKKWFCLVSGLKIVN